MLWGKTKKVETGMYHNGFTRIPNGGSLSYMYLLSAQDVLEHRSPRCKREEDTALRAIVLKSSSALVIGSLSISSSTLTIGIA